MRIWQGLVAVRRQVASSSSSSSSSSSCGDGEEDEGEVEEYPDDNIEGD